MLSISPSRAVSIQNQRSIIRAFHACARLQAAKETATKGKGKARYDTLFASTTKFARSPPSTPSSSSTSKPISPIPKPTSPSPTPIIHPSFQSSITNTRGWQEFENSWSYQPSSSSSSSSSDSKDQVNEDTRTIFEKPLSFNPLFRLFGAGFTAFIGFQWFWIPNNEDDYDTFWKSRPEAGFGTQLWGTIKNIVFWQTPYWALGGAAISIYSLTRKVNIVTKLKQCRIKSSTPGGSDEIFIRMSTLKQVLLKGLSKEPRKLKLGDITVLPVKGPHERNGEVVLNLNVKDSIKPRFSDGQPYIVDTRYGKYLDKTDRPYVLSPSRLRHVFGRLDGQ